MTQDHQNPSSHPDATHRPTAFTRRLTLAGLGLGGLGLLSGAAVAKPGQGKGNAEGNPFRDLQDQIDALESEVDSQAADIKSLKALLSKHDKRIRILESFHKKTKKEKETEEKKKKSP